MPGPQFLSFWLFDDSGFWVIIGVIVLASWALGPRRAPRQCPRCHEQNREAAIYCAQCGAKLPPR